MLYIQSNTFSTKVKPMAKKLHLLNYWLLRTYKTGEKKFKKMPNFLHPCK